MARPNLRVLNGGPYPATMPPRFLGKTCDVCGSELGPITGVCHACLLADLEAAGVDLTSIRNRDYTPSGATGFNRARQL